MTMRCTNVDLSARHFLSPDLTQLLQRTAHRVTASFQNVGVNLGGLNVLVTHELLYGPDIVAVFE